MNLVATDALLGLTETALAIIPGAGGTQRLSRIVGISKAKELIYTAARLSGQDATKIGLANHCVPNGSGMIKAEEIASAIAERGPIAIRMAKKAIDEGIEVRMTDDCYLLDRH